MISGIDVFYVIKDSGTMIASHKNNGISKIDDDLITPMLNGVDIFSNEVFASKISYIALVDGRKIYFKNFNVGGQRLTFVAITNVDFKVENFKKLDGDMIKVKWELDKYKDSTLSNAVSSETVERIGKSIGRIFES